MERVEALPGVDAAVAVSEEGLPGLDAAPAAAANLLLPAAPKEFGPAAASAGPRSCEGEDPRASVTVITYKIYVTAIKTICTALDKTWALNGPGTSWDKLVAQIKAGITHWKITGLIHNKDRH